MDEHKKHRRQIVIQVDLFDLLIAFSLIVIAMMLVIYLATTR